MTANSVSVYDLGRTEYSFAHTLQRRLQAGRIAGDIGDVLLLTEHEPVLTLGRSHPVADLRVAPELLARMGIEVVQTERGGDITYHGPGQLVAYGIINLRDWGLGVVDYVSGLEAAGAATCAAFGVEAKGRSDTRGCWVDGRKIASVGIHARHFVTLHGIALNVARDMSHFELINPCGMADVEMTSLSREAETAPTMADVRGAFVAAFAATFDAAIEWRDARELPGCMKPVRS